MKFHLLAPGGKWQTVIFSPVLLASSCMQIFQRRDRTLLLPPLSAVISNESGAYNLTSLLPGTYTVKAELPGFQTKTFTDVQLGNAVRIRLNFTLNVAGQAQSVEVTITADTILATSNPTIGQALTQKKVSELPVIDAAGRPVGLLDITDLIGLIPKEESQRVIQVA